MPAKQSGLVWQVRTNLVLQLGLLTIVSIVWFVGWMIAGHKGNCHPHDFNCVQGLSSMVGFFYGLGGAFIIFVGGGVTAIFSYVQRMKNK